VSRPSAWELGHRLRDALKREVLARKLRGRLDVDETYVGGRQKGKRGRGAAHKTVVIGLKVRDGRVRSLVIPSVASAEIPKSLQGHVAKGARLFTDALWSSRRVRGLGDRHRRVAHCRRFVRGQTHTQSIEGHWGHVKPNLVARHRSVSPKHLQRYLVEADFTHRLPKDTDFIALMLHRLLAPTAVLPRHEDVATG
jgi:transposase-like protein